MTAVRTVTGGTACLVVCFFLGAAACGGPQRSFKQGSAGAAGISESGGAGGQTGGEDSGGEGGGSAGMESGDLGCTSGALQCNGLQPEMCDASGAWQSKGSVCAEACIGGACAECMPDAKRCDGLQPQVCDSSGAWQNMGSPCPVLCNGGSCSACSAGAKQCNALQPQVCDGSGAWQNSGSACQYACNDSTGACTGSCTPGKKQCSGLQPQVCDSTGVWQSSGPACGTCSSCSSATGTCIVDTGAQCNDSNACTMGEVCQSDGTCGGGSSVFCSGGDQCHTVASCVPASGCPTPALRTGTCDDGNPCTMSESCQSNGSCGGGSKAPITTSCGNNKFCDGKGSCKCRTQSSWNLLNNPGFDGSGNNWLLGGGATYASVDVDSCSGSGSVSLQKLGAYVVQCVPATPNTTYYFGYRYKDAGGANASGTATADVAFLPEGSTCDFGQSTAGDYAYQTYNNNNWIQGAGSATSDSTTAIAMFHISSPASSGYYDQVYLSTSTPGVPAF